MNVLLIFGYCVGERVSLLIVLRYGSCISVKTTSFACLEQNLRRGWRVEVWRRRGTNNLFGQKLFLLQLDDQANYFFI